MVLGEVLKGWMVWGWPLCVSFPFLCALSLSKDTWVVDFWDVTKGWGHWICISLDTLMIESWVLLDLFLFIIYYLFFLRLQDKFMERKDIEKMIWKESRNEVFFYQFPFLQSFSRIYRSWIKWIFLLGKLVEEKYW